VQPNSCTCAPRLSNQRFEVAPDVPLGPWNRGDRFAVSKRG
jgi:hypothetical protein